MASSTLVRKVLLQLSADDGDTEAKLDAITAKAKELGELHPELKARIDTAAASAKVAALKAELTDLAKAKVEPEVDIAAAEAKTEALKLDLDSLKAPEIKPAVQDDPAKAKIGELQAKLDRLRLEKQYDIRIGADVAPAELKIIGLQEQLKALGEPAGKESGGSFGEGFGAMGYLITGGVMAALAALPALAAAGGALAGIALGGALLVGTKSVQGPLYKQFQSLTSGLMSVLRVAALPLVKPLGDAFAQVGKWAKALYPELRAVFGSLGPLVAPLTRGLEGLVSGVMPGFLRLMRAAGPAVAMLGGVMSQLGTSVGGMFAQFAPAVKSSSQFLAGLMSTISNLLPVAGGLANMLAQALGPWMSVIGTKVAPVLARSILQILDAVIPVLPSISQLTGLLIQMAAEGVATLVPPLAGLIGSLAGLGAKVLPSLIPPMVTVIGWLTTLANTTSKVLGLLSHIPGLGFLSGAGASMSPAAFSMPAMGKIPSLSSAVASETADGFGSWADGTTGTPAKGSKAAATAAAKAKKAGEQLGQALNLGMVQELSSAKSAAAAKTAVSKLLADVKAAWSAGLITFQRDSSLTRFLDTQATELEKLAARRAKVTSEIATARKFAASTASSVYSNYDLSSMGGSGNTTVTVGGLLHNLHQGVAQVRKFTADVKKLAKMGLNKAYLSQLIAMGPVAGMELANELASSGLGDISQVNKAEYQLSEASGALGKQAADSMYDTAKNAGKGFLSGLESQESQINKAMQKIAKNMVKTLRTELGIHSPSTVAHDIGANFGGSMGTGLESTVARVALGAKRVTQAMVQAATAHASGTGSAAAAAAAPRVILDIRGAGPELRTFLKKSIRITGGNVQVIGL